MLFVEFPQVQYIDLSELIHVLKAVTHDDKWTLKLIRQSSVWSVSRQSSVTYPSVIRCPLSGG